MMLVRTPFDERLQDLLLTRVPERLGADRHPTVHDDHERVAREPDEDERHPGQPDVHEREHEQRCVREREDAGPDEEVGAARALGERQELDAEPRDDEPPPAEAQTLEPRQPTPEQIAEDDGERDDGEE
jgi:hypothetical protein